MIDIQEISGRKSCWKLWGENWESEKADDIQGGLEIKEINMWK